jgi:putative ABC transport system ATP-binding protein
MNDIAIEAHGLTKRYLSGDKTLTVLERVTFSLPVGASCAVMGPSGSGKTTLLSLCAGLDLPEEGTVRVHDVIINRLSEEERARFRRETIGFVFQSFRLLPTLTALENTMVPLELLGRSGARERAEELLDRVGLSHRLHHFPSQLSGGEQQRVGIARAFIHRPKVLFADEPVGNLDVETGESVLRLLFELNRSEKTTLMLVTHNPELARQTDRVLRLVGGRIVPEADGVAVR